MAMVWGVGGMDEIVKELRKTKKTNRQDISMLITRGKGVGAGW